MDAKKSLSEYCKIGDVVSIEKLLNDKNKISSNHISDVMYYFNIGYFEQRKKEIESEEYTTNIRFYDLQGMGYKYDERRNIVNKFLTKQSKNDTHHKKKQKNQIFIILIICLVEMICL